MLKFIVTFLILTLLCVCCRDLSKKREYYIISYHDSITNGLLNGSIQDSMYPPPMPPAPLSLKWFSNLVFIFDSTDMVYIYQTETAGYEHMIKYTPPGDYDKSKEMHTINFDTIITNYNFPNYIGLRPEHLVAISSDNFIEFVKLNNDIFQLDTNSKSVHIFYIASNKDTIKNDAFYDLNELITSKERYKSRNHCIVRKTTEEEDFVIFFKRHKKTYKPENIEWQTSFINLNLKPFTPQYNRIEHRCFVIRKAKKSFERNSLEVIPIE
jgi:hypothetical protein